MDFSKGPGRRTDTYKEVRGEVYGLYNMGGKFGNMLGPLLWGGAV